MRGCGYNSSVQRSGWGGSARAAHVSIMEIKIILKPCLCQSSKFIGERKIAPRIYQFSVNVPAALPSEKYLLVLNEQEASLCPCQTGRTEKYPALSGNLTMHPLLLSHIVHNQP
jgi:hypothetical protein